MTIVVFVLVRLLPGDAATLQLQDAKTSAADEAALRAQLGLDKPIYVQYVDWLGTLAHGDLGHSFRARNPIAHELAARMPVTLELGMVALMIAAMHRHPIGVLSAVRQDTWAGLRRAQRRRSRCWPSPASGWARWWSRCRRCGGTGRRRSSTCACSTTR